MEMKKINEEDTENIYEEDEQRRRLQMHSQTPTAHMHHHKTFTEHQEQFCHCGQFCKRSW